MSISKFTEDISHISKLADRPSEQGLSAEELKGCFDHAAVQIQDYLNGTLTEELEGQLTKLFGQTACDGETLERKNGTLALCGKEMAVTNSFFGLNGEGQFGFFAPSGTQGLVREISLLSIAVEDWQGEEPPYSCFYPLEGLSEQSVVTISPQVERENVLAIGEAMVLAEQVTGGLRFLALQNKPVRLLEYTLLKEN